MTNKRLSKCDFCSHRTVSGCSVTPNAYNCRQASNEFYAWLEAIKKKKK